jgi:hypothetical protein
MKKLLSILTLALALSSCIGPMGPQGPQGPKGEPGEGINWKVYDFTIESHQWQLVGDPDQLNSYYMYLFEGNDAPKELRYVVDNLGEVSGCYVGKLNNEEIFYPLPYENYFGSSNGTNESLWCEMYKYDYTRSSIAFYVYYSDFYTATPPATCKFRMSFKW